MRWASGWVKAINFLLRITHLRPHQTKQIHPFPWQLGPPYSQGKPGRHRVNKDTNSGKVQQKTERVHSDQKTELHSLRPVHSAPAKAWVTAGRDTTQSCSPSQSQLGVPGEDVAKLQVDFEPVPCPPLQSWADDDRGKRTEQIDTRQHSPLPLASNRCYRDYEGLTWLVPDDRDVSEPESVTLPLPFTDT